MIKGLLVKIISGILGLWLAVHYVPGVSFAGSLKILAFAGLLLGLVNFFVRPLLGLVTLPLKMLTLGLFGFVINAAIVWLLDVFFVDLTIMGIIPLLWTTLLIWGLNTILSLFFRK